MEYLVKGLPSCSRTHSFVINFGAKKSHFLFYNTTIKFITKSGWRSYQKTSSSSDHRYSLDLHNRDYRVTRGLVPGKSAVTSILNHSLVIHRHCCPVRFLQWSSFHSYQSLFKLRFTSDQQISSSSNKGIETMGDDDYMDFLNKSSEAEFHEEANSRMEELKNLDEGIEVPEVLQMATHEAYYMSDADELFMPVALRAEGGFPDKVTFAKLVNFSEPASAEIQIMETCVWDPHGMYKNIIDAVKTAVDKSEIKVYQIIISNTRSEYWIFGIKDNVLLGVKALAVES